MWILNAFLSAFFAGITSILVKIGLTKVDSDVVTALRTVVVLILAWAITFITGSVFTIGAISSKSLLFLILSGIATGISWLYYFRALKLGSANKIAPIDKTSTILTMLLAFIVLGEPISLNMVIGMILIFIGTMTMLNLKKDRVDVKNSKWIIYAIISVVFASLTSILAKIGIEGVDSNLATAIRTSVVVVMAWLIVFIKGKQKEVKLIDKKNWLFIILSGIATSLSWLFYYYALQNGVASIVAPIDKLSIVVTILFSHFLLKEKDSRKTFIGLFILVVGTLILFVHF